jgi:hypothetical protein
MTGSRLPGRNSTFSLNYGGLSSSRHPEASSEAAAAAEARLADITTQMERR